ncbi:inorganic diphosphatase [Patescibacteria group bacterium]|nr:inorganic diphosphatase [Patescibacteria group bacterium]MBU1256537.1 inorganic diphosphatase [Patescibacteria group bacterium]MBU1457101.1 inorganic diphosphatase [Patescibacteria group bacterium]
MNPNKLPAGKNPPEEINVFIEISAQSNIKYEIDQETGILMVDRFLHTASFYPFNYGFIPSTKTGDNDPIDVIVLSEYPVVPCSLIPCKPIGVLLMEDEAGEEEKILAVPLEKIDPLYGKQTMETLADSTKNKIKHFFETYKTIEPGKWVKIKTWGNAEEAKEIIKKKLVNV